MNASNNDYWVERVRGKVSLRNCYIKNVVLFEENSILPLPGRLEASGVESVWGEVSQESPKKSETKIAKQKTTVIMTTW